MISHEKLREITMLVTMHKPLQYLHKFTRYSINTNMSMHSIFNWLKSELTNYYYLTFSYCGAESMDLLDSYVVILVIGSIVITFWHPPSFLFLLLMLALVFKKMLDWIIYCFIILQIFLYGD